METASRPPLTDSPWFWLYTFATFALVLLLVFGDKFNALRTQDERHYQGRARALQAKQGQEPTVPLSSDGHNWLTLRPIYMVLALLIAAGWITLWWQRWRRLPPPVRPETGSPP